MTDSHCVHCVTASGALAHTRVSPPPPGESRADALHVRALACRRGARTLFAGLDLDLEAGDAVWLRAANGYGKTTLLRVLAGLAKPASGTVEWTRGRVRSSRPRLLYLAHANALKDDLTVAESLHHLAALHGLDAAPAAIDDAIRRFGLVSRRHAPIRTLSQGQRRRVALMRLCLSPPQATWLLDEPYDALDTAGVALVDGLLAAHVARGGNVLLTSHVPPSIDGVALRAVSLDAAPDAAAAAVVTS